MMSQKQLKGRLHTPAELQSSSRNSFVASRSCPAWKIELGPKYVPQKSPVTDWTRFELPD
jgi:hypothetical protein